MDSGIYPNLKQVLNFVETAKMTAMQNALRSQPSVVVVNRAKPFDPSKFIGSGWSRKNFLSDESTAENVQSLALTAIDFSKRSFAHNLMQKGKPVAINGSKKVMKTNRRVQYDAGIGQALYEQKDQITLRWLYDKYGIEWFELTGTVLFAPNCEMLHSLYLIRRKRGSWRWKCSCCNDYPPFN